MPEMRLLSWNVNGLRAVYKKGFIAWLMEERPDILCVQETKSQEEQLPEELTHVPGYASSFAWAEKKGYSGVGLYSNRQPKRVMRGFGINRFDQEGRTLVVDYGDFILLNVYFPNGKLSRERLEYKMAFYDAFLDYVVALKKRNKKLIICGDVNTAHREIDLARPKENQKVSGFLPQERAWIDRFIAHGFLDTFRMFNIDAGQYSWWDYKTRARERNIGWRIDYFYISENLSKQLKSAFIMPDVMGSDHCPVGITIRV
ncbi:MAG: exodeoxyribonuclease III [candidate division WOR-3 bacterium]|nr:MAG: exodeoxyribonuclease III [candidate division WOR-3 bacterium]